MLKVPAPSFCQMCVGILVHTQTEANEERDGARLNRLPGGGNCPKWPLHFIVNRTSTVFRSGQNIRCSHTLPGLT